jgi:hypothetical protein
MSEPNYDEIRRRITKRYENRAEFFIHLVTFVIINALLWSELVFRRGWLLTAFTALWFIGLVAHFINFLMSEARERAIELAIEREHYWGSNSGDGRKLKRDSYTRLSDDGELIDVVDDDWSAKEQHHRS